MHPPRMIAETKSIAMLSVRMVYNTLRQYLNCSCLDSTFLQCNMTRIAVKNELIQSLHPVFTLHFLLKHLELQTV